MLGYEALCGNRPFFAGFRVFPWLMTGSKKITGLGRLLLDNNTPCYLSGRLLFQPNAPIREFRHGQLESHRVMTFNELLARLGA